MATLGGGVRTTSKPSGTPDRRTRTRAGKEVAVLGAIRSRSVGRAGAMVREVVQGNGAVGLEVVSSVRRFTQLQKVVLNSVLLLLDSWSRLEGPIAIPDVGVLNPLTGEQLFNRQ